MTKVAPLFACLAFFAVAPGCHGSSSSSSKTPTPDAPALLQQDCDPIVPDACGYPFPSNVWTTPDPKTATGMHLYFGHTTLPLYAQPDKHVDPTPWANRDGFSPGSSLMAFFPNATKAGLPDPDHIAASLDPNSPTIVIEADTGARVPHWAELDMLVTTPEDQRAFFIHPAVRLKDATRYVVAIRNVADSSGAPLPPSPVFRALRDGAASDDLSVAPRRALYADIFGKLQTAGIDKSNLQLAWDFTTASKDNTTRWLVHMRDDALAKVGSDGPPYKITSVIDNQATWQAQATCNAGDNIVPKAAPNSFYYTCTTPGTTGATEPAWPTCGDSSSRPTVADGGAVWTCAGGAPTPAHIRRRIIGKMTVPLYLDKPGPGASLVFGADGLPRQNGTAEFEFLVQIPNSVVKSGNRAPILANAHGLFGEKEEGQNGFLAETIDREGYVEIAMDLIGMAHDDTNFVSNVMLVSDIGQFQHLVDRMHQGFLNELVAMRMMMGKMAKDPATQINSKPTIDETTRYYRGDSQGGISGGVYMAITTDVTRGLLGEPGAPYNILLDRSKDFAPFFLILKGVYQSALDVQLGLDLIQSLWDRAEPDGYVPYISENLLPNTPAHNVLLHVGIGDHQVTPLGAHFEARTLGAKTLKQAPRGLFGIDAADSGFTGNGIVEWDFGLPPAPLTNTPMGACDDPHDYIRKFPEAQDMSDQFFRTGKINMTCNGGAGPCKAPPNWEDPSAKNEPDCP